MREPETTTEMSQASDRGLIAPRWHTALLVVLLLSVAAVGTLLQRRGAPTSVHPGAAGRVMTVYLPLLVVQWSLALYVCRIGRPRSALRSLLGARWTSVGRACVDIALAACGWLLIKATEFAWASVLREGAAPSTVAMLPHTVSERLMWIAVSVSVGFCEEVVFRGYLQRQFEAFSGRAGVAVALQAALFGIAHGEQGSAAVARATLYGVGFGVLARWRRSLVPGIVCHAWTDLASGLLRV